MVQDVDYTTSTKKQIAQHMIEADAPTVAQKIKTLILTQPSKESLSKIASIIRQKDIIIKSGLIFAELEKIQPEISMKIWYKICDLDQKEDPKIWNYKLLGEGTWENATVEQCRNYLKYAIRAGNYVPGFFGGFMGTVNTNNLVIALIGCTKIKSLDLLMDNLTSVPAHISQLIQMRTLNFHDNNINSIQTNDFKQLVNLCSLDLSKVGINNIEAASFKDLIKLERLILSSNKIIELDKHLFKNLKNIKYLNLGNNLITALHQDHFKNLNNLEILDLKNNQIRNLHKNAFRNLHNIKCILLFNSFHDDFFISQDAFKPIKKQMIEAFKASPLAAKIAIIQNLSKVVKAGFYKSKIVKGAWKISKEEERKSKLFLRPLGDLLKSMLSVEEQKSITITPIAHNLYINKIAVVQDVDYTTSTKKQIAQHMMEADAPTVAQKIKTLILKQPSKKSLSKIASIIRQKDIIIKSGLIFAELEKIQPEISMKIWYKICDLDQKEDPKIWNWQLLKGEPWQNAAIEPSLDLSNVGINNIEAASFKDLIKLKYLNLSSNKIIELDKHLFKNFKNLTHLSLRNNSITALHQDHFKNLKNLEILDLKNNQIRSLNKNAFSNLHNIKHILLFNSFHDDFFVSQDTFKPIKKQMIEAFKASPLAAKIAIIQNLSKVVKAGFHTSKIVKGAWKISKEEERKSKLFLRPLGDLLKSMLSAEEQKSIKITPIEFRYAFGYY